MNKLTGSKDAKDKRDKPRLSLIPRDALIELGKALTAGEVHYGTHNWKKGIPISFLLDAAIRHIYQFADGENIDKETQTNHLGCAMANLSFAITMLNTRPEADDRYKLPESGVIKDTHKGLSANVCIDYIPTHLTKLREKVLKNAISNKKISKKTSKSRKVRKTRI